MCGGPTQQQQQAATTNLNTQSNLAGIESSDLDASAPFLTNEMQNGLPYFGAQTQYATSGIANQIDQAKAGQASQLAGYGSALPSGFAEADKTNLEAQGAQAFDQNQLSLLQQQQAAKNNAASLLSGQGLGAASTSVGAGQSVLQAPLQNNFWSNLVGGIVSGAGNIPFAFSG